MKIKKDRQCEGKCEEKVRMSVVGVIKERGN